MAGGSGGKRQCGGCQYGGWQRGGLRDGVRTIHLSRAATIAMLSARFKIVFIRANLSRVPKRAGGDDDVMLYVKWHQMYDAMHTVWGVGCGPHCGVWGASTSRLAYAPMAALRTVAIMRCNPIPIPNPPSQWSIQALYARTRTAFITRIITPRILSPSSSHASHEPQARAKPAWIIRRPTALCQ